MRTLEHRLRRSLRLVYVTLTVAAVELGLRTSTLPRLTRLLGVDGRRRTSAPLAPSVFRRRTVDADHCLARWPVETTCLRRALVVGHQLRRYGPVLRLGVRREDGEVKAHAWLEIDGESLDPTSADFASLEPVRST